MADLGSYTFFTATNRCTGQRFMMRNDYGSGFGQPGEFFCWFNQVYEIEALGGGGTFHINVATFYSTYAAAYLQCPCGLVPQPPTNCQDFERISEYFYFYFDNNCSVNSQQVCWVNSLGTLDYYTFRGREDTGYDVSRQEFQQAPKLYTEGWDEVSYYGWNPQNKVWNTQQALTGILHTGIIPKSDADFITEELLRSSSVWLIDDEGDLYPIILTNSEVVKPNFQRPNQVSISIEYKGGFPERRQNT